VQQVLDIAQAHLTPAAEIADKFNERLKDVSCCVM
jgi:hypothetical protein